MPSVPCSILSIKSKRAKRRIRSRRIAERRFATGIKFSQEPPPDRYANALRHRAIEYFSLAGQLADLQACLAAGYPFVFGMSIFPSFGTQTVAQTGVVPMPGPTEAVVCGHAVMAVGYEQSAQTFLIRNSFGPDWGMRGYFTVPYAFMESRAYSDNFWTIRRV